MLGNSQIGMSVTKGTSCGHIRGKKRLFGSLEFNDGTCCSHRSFRMGIWKLKRSLFSQSEVLWAKGGQLDFPVKEQDSGEVWKYAHPGHFLFQTPIFFSRVHGYNYNYTCVGISILVGNLLNK